MSTFNQAQMERRLVERTISFSLPNEFDSVPLSRVISRLPPPPLLSLKCLNSSRLDGNEIQGTELR